MMCSLSDDDDDENYPRWGNQDGSISLSQFQTPSQEDKLATIHRQDTNVKIPEHGGDASLWTTEAEKDFIKRVKEVV